MFKLTGEYDLTFARIGAFICKALKGEAIVLYAESLITPQMKASGSPIG